MKIMRTPEECFANLPGYDFEPHYVEIHDDDGTPIRIHHVDEGPQDAAPILLMHGNPTWAYLYRNMIPGLVDAGHRVIAVDLIGCGRSDKPATRDDYTLARHYDWMSKWLTTMDLRDVTLFCQDWGGTIGLYLVATFPERFSRVVASNTGLPLGEGESEFMKMWVGMMREADAFPWDMFAQGMSANLSEDEIAAYRAPFPSAEYEAGILRFPLLIAVQPDNPGAPLNRAAWEKLKKFDKPFLTIFGALDPVSRGWDKRAQADIPGAKEQNHEMIDHANHFIQEDAPEILVEKINAFIGGAHS
ncbi:haloalkane dehalogenase [Parvibaculum sp.]|jgi:haloalkane dehalogenase|uniref:haloalkane dehalogenase n=1 Tax=Parvibaculum sp. TaxID=2024848 RepID=UPI001AFFE49C|nr:haloalkane dehalogenase [Parvibaculum sp.]MBO6634417.1 haloalkane dehalogenase [Parvibaculum sp.]MBO6679174.1 haloalkane dehalogenase [Parvibaculum sp.]MBO6685685.1 haloalkane dehalogenase [Parvibaculum sp.]